MLDSAIAIIGPPAVGKTTLTMQLGQLSGRRVFRLREHVPETILAATATSAERLGWIDDLTVTMALRSYLDSVVDDGTAHTVFFDNFPDRANRSISSSRPCASWRQRVSCTRLNSWLTRLRDRRVCHHCERDPIHDPRLPAVPSPADPRRCACCNNILHPRRGDAPRLFSARMRRHWQTAEGIREAFASVGIAILQIESNKPPEQIASELLSLLNARSTPS